MDLFFAPVFCRERAGSSCAGCTPKQIARERPAAARCPRPTYMPPLIYLTACVHGLDLRRLVYVSCGFEALERDLRWVRSPLYFAA